MEGEGEREGEGRHTARLHHTTKPTGVCVPMCVCHPSLDVGLVHSCDTLPPLLLGILEGKLRHTH